MSLKVTSRKTMTNLGGGGSYAGKKRKEEVKVQCYAKHLVVLKMRNANINM